MDAELRRWLAPTGPLRAAINLANPVLVSDASAAEPRGVAPALASLIAEGLGVDLITVGYPSPGMIADRVDDDEWDIALIGADPSRAATIDFTSPYAEIEAGYLVGPDSELHDVEEVDAPGVTIVAIERSAYELWLRSHLRHATLISVKDAVEARSVFAGQSRGVLAGLRPSLVEEARLVARSALLDGRFMAVQQAVGVRRGNVAATGQLEGIVERAVASGAVQELFDRFGVGSALSVPRRRPVPFYIASYSVASPWAAADRGHGAGIVSAWLDPVSGAIETTQAIWERDPAFIAVDRAVEVVWAITELDSDGELISYRIDEDTSLVEEGRSTTGAISACHVTIDLGHRVAFVCHFLGGVLSTIALDERGLPDRLIGITALPTVVRGDDRAALDSRPHCSVVIGNDELLVTDHGRDLVALYRISGHGRDVSIRLLDALPLPTPTGPRHVARRAAGDLFYVSNENAASVSVIRRVTKGGIHLELVQTEPSPGLGRAVSLPAEIAIHPTLDVLYMANRRDDSISTFDIDVTGRIRHREAVETRGEWPRHFAISPDGLFLVLGDQNSDVVVSYRVDASGSLRWSGHELVVASPSNIRF